MSGRRRRRGGDHGGAHGGAWKVAYADFVTAMMAFFIVMWVMSMSPEEREAVAGYFKDPSGFAAGGSGGNAPASLMEGGAPSEGAALIPLEGTDLQGLQLIENELRQAIADRPELEAIRDSIVIEITDEGLRIELIDDDDDSPFFEVGEADMKPLTTELLLLTATTLAKTNDAIAIEGHTDSRAYSGAKPDYGNWELSTDRANAARRVMEPLLTQGQLTAVRGLADRQLRDPQDPLNPANRRVSILVKQVSPEPTDLSEEGSAPPGGPVAPDG